MFASLPFVFGALVAVQSPAPLLESCRQSYESFEPAPAVAQCQAAAENDALSTEQRIEALRLLAQSHLLANDDRSATQAFTRMLALDDTLLLAKDAGPRERDVFARARFIVDSDGRIHASHSLGADGELVVKVFDPLKRVASGRVRVSAGDRIRVASLPLRRETDANVTLTGPLPRLTDAREIQYEIMLDGWTGAPLVVDANLRGTANQKELPNADPTGPTFSPWGFGVLAAGVGIEVCWVCGVTPLITAREDLNLSEDEYTVIVLAGTFAGIAVIGTGVGMILFMRE